MKELIEKLELNKVYFGCDIFKMIDNHMKDHPNYLLKTQNGLKGYVYKLNKKWGNNNKCFFILDNNFNYISISFRFTFRGYQEKTEVHKAFRTAIEPDIINFKKTFIINKTKCAITGKLLTGKYHVDHYDYNFKDVVDMFLMHYNKTYDDLFKYVINDNSKRYFNNDNLIHYFRLFHNNNTKLRFTTVNANLSRTK